MGETCTASFFSSRFIYCFSMQFILKKYLKEIFFKLKCNFSNYFFLAQFNTCASFLLSPLTNVMTIFVVEVSLIDKTSLWSKNCELMSFDSTRC